MHFGRRTLPSHFIDVFVANLEPSAKILQWKCARARVRLVKIPLALCKCEICMQLSDEKDKDCETDPHNQIRLR